jgi:hypothetical protein
MSCDIRTCRHCGASNYEHNHPADGSAWVKTGPRHSVHLKCALAKKGAAFFAQLPTHRLAQLPIFEIQDLGFGDAFRAELAKRPTTTGAAV